MKKVKRILSVLLVVVMCLTSAPLSGFVGIEWPEWSLSAEAEDEYELPDNAVDYSNLTANEYITRVLLDYDYIGSSNGYDPGSGTIAKNWLSFYLDADKASLARGLYKDLKNTTSFMNSVAAWKTLNFDPSEAYENYLDEKEYYMAVLYSILDTQLNDSEFLDAWNNTNNESIMSLSKEITGFMETSYDIDIDKLSKVNIADFTESQMDEIWGKLKTSKSGKELQGLLGDNLDIIKGVGTGCTTIYDLCTTVSTYSQLATLSSTVEDVLYALYLSVPSSNSPFKKAAKEVYEICSEQMSANIYTMIESGKAMAKVAFSSVVGLMWDATLNVVSGLGTTIKLGQVIGKSISNFCFSTDKIIENFYVLEATCKLEDAMLDTVELLANTFKNNTSVENANNYIKSIEFLFATYTQSAEYAYNFVYTAKNEGLANKVSSIFGGDSTVDEYRETIDYCQELYDNAKNDMTNLEGYRWFYEDDAPSAYKEYFEPEKEENTSDISSAYSPSVEPLYVEPSIDIENKNCAVFEYRLESDDTLTIVGCHPMSCGNIEIPKDIGGKAVRKIYSNAFKNCTKITGVTTNSTLREIGSEAFSGCSSLSEVKLNKGLTDMDNQVFKGTAITSITIPSTVTSMYTTGGTASNWGALNGASNLKTVIFSYGILKIPSYALNKGSSVTSVVIPSGVTEIETRAFYDCTSLATITLPNSLQKIGSSAFANCSELTKVIMPDSLREIGSEAFSGCSSLSEVKLNEGLTDMDNQVFKGTAITSITIPSTVTSMYTTGGTASNWGALNGASNLKTVIFSYGILKIPSYALNKGSSITSISIPNTVVEIAAYAFGSCTGITEIYMPLSVTKINGNAFNGCSGIADVYYVGNEEMWNKISIGTNNEPLTNATIHYNYNHSSHTYYPSVTKDALCLESGIITYSCFCGASYTDTIPAKGHQMGEYVLVKPATCKEKGEEKSFCDLCGTYVSREIDYAAHIDSNGDKICDVCGESTITIVESDSFGYYGDNLLWTLYSDGELVISGSGRMHDYG